MGHLGLTPQSVHVMGGFRVQAKQADAADVLLADAEAIEARLLRGRSSRRSQTWSRPWSQTGWPSRRSGSAQAPAATARSSSPTTCSVSARLRPPSSSGGTPTCAVSIVDAVSRWAGRREKRRISRRTPRPITCPGEPEGLSCTR